MSIESFSALILAIFGIVASVGIIILVVLAVNIYLRLRPILGSIQKTVKTVEDVTATVADGVAKPVAHVISFIQGVRNAFGLFKQSAGREED